MGQDLDFDNIVNDYPTLEVIRPPQLIGEPMEQDHVQFRHMMRALEALGRCSAWMRHTGSDAELPIVENIKNQILAYFDKTYDVAVYALAGKTVYALGEKRPHRGDNLRRVLAWFDENYGTEFLS
jgi:hypothetical protein